MVEVAEDPQDWSDTDFYCSISLLLHFMISSSSDLITRVHNLSIEEAAKWASCFLGRQDFRPTWPPRVSLKLYLLYVFTALSNRLWAVVVDHRLDHDQCCLAHWIWISIWLNTSESLCHHCVVSVSAGWRKTIHFQSLTFLEIPL